MDLLYPFGGALVAPFAAMYAASNHFENSGSEKQATGVALRADLDWLRGPGRLVLLLSTRRLQTVALEHCRGQDGASVFGRCSGFSRFLPQRCSDFHDRGPVSKGL